MTGLVVKVNDDMLIGSLRNLYVQGYISLEDYGACLRRYKERKEND